MVETAAAALCKCIGRPCKILSLIPIPECKKSSKCGNLLEHNIILVSNEANVSYFFIELTDKEGNKFGFRWIMEKVIINSEFKDCWMTIGVSKPLLIAKSA